MLVDNSSNIDTKLFNYIAYNKMNGKYDIMDILIKRQNFISNDMENSMTNNIDEMLRIKLLGRGNNLENMDNLEIIKRANQIPDAQVREMYNEIKETLASNSTAPEIVQMEIRNFLNNFLNDENMSMKVYMFLNTEKGVSEFGDLRKLRKEDLKTALRLVNSDEEVLEKTVKSIVSSLA